MVRERRKRPSEPPPQRPHRPHDLGPRLFRRGPWWAADLRYLDAGRPTLQNPKAPGWPGHIPPGQEHRTDQEDLAREWAWAYHRWYQGDRRREALGLPAAPRPLAKAAEEWLTHRKRSVEHNTYSTSRTAVRHLEEYLGASATTADVGAVDRDGTLRMQRLFDELVDLGYAISTLLTYRHSLGAFCEWLGQGELNTARRITLPDPGSPDAVPWTDDDLAQLREAADKVDASKRGRFAARLHRRALELGLGTGGRQQELFAVRWERFRPGDRTVRITEQLVKDGSGSKGLKGKTGRTALVLPSWWEHHQEGASGLVLCNADGSAIGSQSRLQRDLIQRTLDTAGLNGPGKGWHTLRHTYARLFLEGGGYMEDLQLSLGHASITITERTYGHLRPDFAAARARGKIYGDGGPQLVR